MKDYMHMLLSLPSTLLVLITVSAASISADLGIPISLPAHIKYFPEDGDLIRRGLSAMEQMANRAPIGVQKMSEREDEMFFLDYWQFEDVASLRHEFARRSVPAHDANHTMDQILLPPILLHSNTFEQSPLQERLPMFARDVFKRFTCPVGTNSCDSISRPYACCGTDEVCISVKNSGLGDVGCCPAGQSCNSIVTECDTAAGFKSCPGFEGGGCCIPNFDCFGIGCAINQTSTVTTTAPAVTVTRCPDSYSTCPASLGGGCCQSGAGCGTGRTCLMPSTGLASQTPTTTITTFPSVTAAGAPARPTGDSESSEAADPSTTTVGTQVIAVCPTNYYFCSAYYRPGCCRIGRDCSTTNCPAATASETVVSGGVTIVVPAGSLEGGSTYQTTALITGVVAAATTTLRSGACQIGWLSCAQTDGGGCCPPNFGCGTSCTATASGLTGTVARVEPASASNLLGAPMLHYMILTSVFISSVFVLT